MTLRLRLMLAFLLVVVVPLLVAVVVVGRGVPHTVDAAARNRLDTSRAGAVTFLQQLCSESRLVAVDVARSAVGTAPTLRAVDLRHAVDGAVAGGVVDYAVVARPARGGGGTVSQTAGRLPGGGHPPPSALGSCSRRVAPSSGLSAFGDSVQIRSTSGRLLGEAGAAIGLDQGFARRLATTTNAQVTLVLAGHPVASTEPARTAAALAAVGPRLQDAAGRAAAGRLATAVDVGPGEPLLILSVSRQRVAGLEGLLIGVVLIGIVLAALIGWLLARVTTRPLAELSDAAARVAGGDLETHIDVGSQDEVGQLATAFNEMTDELRTYVRELESSRDELRSNLARLGDTLSSTHDLGRILSVILETAVSSVRATAGAAYVVTPAKDALVLRAGHGLDRRAAESRLPLGAGVTGHVAATGKPVRGRAGSKGVTLAPGEPTATELISMPLLSSGGVLGVLNLYDRADGRPFDAGDLATIRTFAGQAAVALDNVLLHQEAQRLSVTDALTGLGNYRNCQATLAREVERAARFGRSLAVLMLDVDRFKLVNDSYGHQVGDAVLVEIAQRLLAEVREVDFVARYGGEEFVVVLPETSTEGADHTAERICAAMRERLFAVDSRELSVTVSVGAAVFPEHGDSAVALLRAADEALYAAKEDGRDRWRMAATAHGGRSR